MDSKENYPYLVITFREDCAYDFFPVEYSDYLPYCDGMVGLPGAHYYTLILNSRTWELFDYLLKQNLDKRLFYSGGTIDRILKMELVIEEQSNNCRLRFSTNREENLFNFRPFWIKDYIDKTQFRMPMEEVITNKKEWDWDTT